MGADLKPDWIRSLFGLIAQWSGGDPEWEPLATTDDEQWLGTKVLVTFAPSLVVPAGRSAAFYLTMAEGLAGLMQFMKRSPSGEIPLESVEHVWAELAEALAMRAADAGVARSAMVQAASGDADFARYLDGHWDEVSPE
jgi:hypothetical protein